MEITYTIIGADGAQYGPITLDQLKSWIVEGRVTGGTKVLRSDTNSWLPATNYGELGLPETIAAAVPISPRGVSGGYAGVNPALERQIQLGARWFFWIAGFSLVNTLMAATSQGFRFYLGILGITDLIYSLTSQMDGNQTKALVLNIAAAAVYVLFGVFARRRQSWSFIAGMIFYALDALVFIRSSEWLVLGFHVLLLFFIFKGLRANLQAKSQS